MKGVDDRPTLRVVIVTYYSAADLPQCLQALRSATVLFATTTVVVDNASADGSADAAAEEGVVVIRNATNVGFARAVNQGLRGVDEDLILILNPDVRLGTETVVALAEVLKDRLDAAAGPRLMDQEGNQATRGYYLRTPTLWQFLFFYTRLLGPLASQGRRCRYLEHCELGHQSAPVEQIPGAALLLTRHALEAVGPFDERFPIWFEDVDWCARARQAGMRLWYVGGAEACHIGGRSFLVWSKLEREVVFFRSMRIYFRIHQPVLAPIVATLTVVDRLVRLVVTRRLHHLGFLRGYLRRADVLPSAPTA